MQVAIHLGAHCTDEDRLLRTLLRNKDVLARQGIAVPGPGRYRNVLREAAEKLQGEPASQETRDILLDGILDDDSARRVVLTHESFICVPTRVFEGGILYEKAGYKPMWLRNLFPGDEVEFFLAIRNPATFIPAVFHHKWQKRDNFHQFLQGTDVGEVRWSDVIVAIRESNPDTPLTVWCNEDTPLIWPEVLQRVSGHAPGTRIKGGLDILAEIMKREGKRRLRRYLADNPPKSERQRRRILAAFLEKYAIEEAVEEELDVPGWTDATVAELTLNYERDLDEIAAIPGVSFIEP
jgi:hypothetical protein